MAWEMVEEMDVASSDTRAAKAAAETPKQGDADPDADASKPQRQVVYKDATEAVKAALEASKTQATSIEARMAWDEVEEIDSANAHHRTVGSG